ncbi:hypothetical protein E3E23_04590 [Thermococcus sp. CX2]|uniref:hypothetical protein n=1 Tax=Thermococcus sp. CX2 TaxID=163006 RepID=UPI00143A41BC|nr:hypothetical protein [Thermococcus sp. CX2]NJE85106.1 hypothetical protein [Thermococcus sp. CX2]
MNGRTLTKLLVFSIILLLLIVMFYFRILPQRTEHNEGSKNCLLTSNATYWPSMPVVTVHRYLSNGSIVEYGESFTPWPHEDKGFYVIEDWAEELGISPPCYITKATGKAVLEAEGKAGYGLFLRWRVKNDGNSWSDLKRVDKRKETAVSAGSVRIAVYTIPISNGSWKIEAGELLENPYWFNSTGGGRFVSTWFNGTCTCKPEEILKATLNKIKFSGFKEKEHVEILETEALKPMYSAFFVRDSQYLYVEFAQVKGMDLVRVLMIMGDEEVVKAYAEAFTAGSVGG